jgi:hypothetical protein
MSARRKAIKNYIIALLIFVALVCAFTGGIGFYVAGFLALFGLERFVAWTWSEGKKLKVPPGDSAG